MPRNINFVTIVITWRALKKLTTEQNDNKTDREGEGGEGDDPSRDISHQG